MANGVVYVGSHDAYVYALKASTGAKLWSYRTGDFVDSSPAVANGVVYVGSSDGDVYALNASTGAHCGATRRLLPVVGSSPAVANGVVYVGSIPTCNFNALNARTGTTLWSYPIWYSVYSSPVVANGRVYVGSYDGNVYAFGLKNGQE